MQPRVLAAVCAVLVIAPLALLAFYKAYPAHDPILMNDQLHFWAVGVTSAASAIACAVIMVASRSLRETRLLFLALAFVAIGGIFSIHGLLTPGLIVHNLYAPLLVSSWASIVTGAVLVALSAMRLPAAVEAAVQRAGGAIFAWCTIAVYAYVVLSLSMLHWLDWAPTDRSPVQYILTATATALFAFAAWRYWQAYLFARLPSQAAMVIALVLLADVPVVLLWGVPWAYSWWMYHVLYGAAFVVIFAGWAIEAQRAGSLKVIAEALSMRDALAALERGKDAHLVELVDAIEAKDMDTLGHVRRVSAYALAIGRRLHLSPGELRSLALAAEMHDVGKIGTPDQILMKPGPLDPDELREMRLHTGRGYEIASRVSSLRDVAPVIRAHHERLNGSGYPDGLRGDDIPLFARIIAVADSYDAMTSDRPYRNAMTQQAALAELARTRGSELDAACVDAFVAWLHEEERAAA